MSHGALTGLATLAVLLLVAVPASADEGRRYVAPDASGGVVLWTNWTSEEGFAGLKPTVGVLDAGIPVELLDARECRDLARVRLLAGPLKGLAGCVAAQRLTHIKPETSPAAGPTPSPRPRLVSRRSPRIDGRPVRLDAAGVPRLG